MQHLSTADLTDNETALIRNIESMLSLSYLSPGDKLRVDDAGGLGVDRSGRLQGVYRFFNGDTRINGTDKLRKVMSDAFVQAGAHRNREPTRGRLFAAYEAVRTGMRALMVTYEDDTKMRVRVRMILDEAEEYMRSLHPDDLGRRAPSARLAVAR